MSETEIHGDIEPGFEPVAAAFERSNVETEGFDSSVFLRGLRLSGVEETPICLHCGALMHRQWPPAEFRDACNRPVTVLV